MTIQASSGLPETVLQLSTAVINEAAGTNERDLIMQSTVSVCYTCMMCVCLNKVTEDCVIDVFMF